jgi:hypothetical protein
VTSYLDRDGDVWSPEGHDLYACRGYFPRSLEDVRDTYGPLTPVNDSPEEVPVMTREEALAKATEHVNALATNGRGFQDGVRFADKVEAVERLARFLAGDRSEA